MTSYKIRALKANFRDPWEIQWDEVDDKDADAFYVNEISSDGTIGKWIAEFTLYEDAELFVRAKEAV